MGNLSVRSYCEMQALWPSSGRHILASYDADTIRVYQAYRPEIARYAVDRQHFGGEFSYSRMSWIKPNFLWMMYRSGWATKPGQEHVLAVTLPRSFFDSLLRDAVPSSFDATLFESNAHWRQAVESSDVRLQWDPDHDPFGAALERRAVQLGLRGDALRQYGKELPIRIDDVTEFVALQRERLAQGVELLEVPEERVYLPAGGAGGP